MLISNVSVRTTGKTTNTSLLLHALHERSEEKGHKREYKDIIGYDADISQQLLNWHGTSGYPFPVVGAQSEGFHNTYASIHPKDRIGVADVGHLEDHISVGRSLLRVTDLAIVNTVTSRADKERAEGEVHIRKFIYDDVASLRLDGNPPPAWILLVRTPPHKNSIDVREAKKYYIDKGWNVFDTVIPYLVEYLGIGAEVPIDDAGAAHHDLVSEMEDKGLI